jgi:hypothetical protein
MNFGAMNYHFGFFMNEGAVAQPSNQQNVG